MISLEALGGPRDGQSLTLPSFSGMVERLRMMSVQGETLTLSKDDGDLFRAALCSLGALGVVTEVQLRGVERYRLRETSEVLSLKEAMLQVERDKDRYRHVELFAFPLGGTAILKRMELTEDPAEIFPKDASAETLETLCELTLRAGWLVRPIQKMLGWLVEDTIRQGPAYRVFANHRAVRFNEMEYTVPAETGLACLEEVCDTMKRNGSNILFPIEFRFSAADNSLIGMFSKRAGASLSLHAYYKQDHWPFFHTVEPILQRAQGRPHWGKLHSMDAAQLAAVYPHFERFRELRRQLDPQGKLLNPHLRKILGVPA